MTGFTKMNVSVRFLAFSTILSLLISAFPVSFFIAEAASIDITVNSSVLSATVNEQVNFVVSVVTSDSVATDDTVVEVSDDGGGNFYTGTTGGACNSVTPDLDNEFSISANKGVCYSNSVPGDYTITVQLLDGPEGSPIGASQTVSVNVKEIEVIEPVLGCMDESALNFDVDATEDNGSCAFKAPDEDLEVSPVYGCMDSSATNYNADATEEGDISCEYVDNTPVNDSSSQCVSGEKDWAHAVHWSLPGKKKEGSVITDVNRINPESVLGEADWTAGGSTGFFSLGFGGSIKVHFNKYVLDVEGVDISIHEATNGTNYPLEKAEVWVSQNGDDWFMVGYADNTATDRVTYLDISSSGLSWIQYVKVIDVSDPALHVADADGFDLDAVDATETVCTKPEPKPLQECEFEGHKYNQGGTPLTGWAIGLMKIITFNDDTITKYDVATSTTDSDGYYCLEWDGYSNTPTHAENTKSFAYRVYEVLKDGWSYWSIEKGPVNTTPEVMADEDVLIEDGRVSVQVGETNGYVYANKAYHVDFYNYQDGEVDTDTDRYIIKGYIWHDNNENTLWDGFEEEQQGEEGLSGWTVSITNGETKYSTTTDENGYYFFEVPAGTWTITETVEDGWGSTTQTEYIVTVPEVLVVTFLQSLVEYIIPTAHAAVIGEYGPYNFGNNELSITTTGGGGGGGGGRRLSTPSPTPQVLGVSDTPILEVLGDQITVVPTGGVGAGRGGSSNTGSGVVTYISVLTILFSLFIFRTSVLCK